MSSWPFPSQSIYTLTVESYNCSHRKMDINLQLKIHIQLFPFGLFQLFMFTLSELISVIDQTDSVFLAVQKLGHISPRIIFLMVLPDHRAISITITTGDKQLRHSYNK